MSDFLKIAEEIAREAHKDQRYGEKSYVDGHLLPVTSIIDRLQYGRKYQATGWLHDTVEDTNITLNQLISEGIPEDVVYAVGLLTKKEDVNHTEYLAKIITNRYATVGKFADSSANFSTTMLLTPKSGEDGYRMARAFRYVRNLAYLEPHLPDPADGE